MMHKMHYLMQNYILLLANTDYQLNKQINACNVILRIANVSSTYNKTCYTNSTIAVQINKKQFNSLSRTNDSLNSHKLCPIPHCVNKKVRHISDPDV